MGYLFSLQITNLDFIQNFLQSLIMLYDCFALYLNKTYSLGLVFHCLKNTLAEFLFALPNFLYQRLQGFFDLSHNDLFYFKIHNEDI